MPYDFDRHRSTELHLVVIADIFRPSFTSKVGAVKLRGDVIV